MGLIRTLHQGDCFKIGPIAMRVVKKNNQFKLIIEAPRAIKINRMLGEEFDRYASRLKQEREKDVGTWHCCRDDRVGC